MFQEFTDRPIPPMKTEEVMTTEMGTRQEYPQEYPQDPPAQVDNGVQHLLLLQDNLLDNLSSTLRVLRQQVSPVMRDLPPPVEASDKVQAVDTFPDEHSNVAVVLRSRNVRIEQITEAVKDILKGLDL